MSLWQWLQEFKIQHKGQSKVINKLQVWDFIYGHSFRTELPLVAIGKPSLSRGMLLILPSVLDVKSSSGMIWM